jgi:hypothetical protein
MSKPSFPLAGNWDPTAFNKIFPAQGQSFYGSQEDNELGQLLQQYSKDKPAIDPSKLGEMGGLVYALQNPSPTSSILQAQIQDIGARRASKLSRENIDYAVAQQNKYEKERDERRFKYGMLANLSQLPGQIFSQNASYKLLGSQMGTQSLANILNTPSASFATIPFQPQKYLS